ncbi:uncharacterized protein cenpt isoform X2 [Syngnathoides biaculeatus]|uniref:uncharacterized protein cenpt isoform X2 n=1 Tax=Syngnathoides biaculeatus TaxID=300417 RepID=UPI002ADDE0D7|nr:uncharacterized protein cenpt isoform X2 [Syngnathoides biaculeatus]
MFPPKQAGSIAAMSVRRRQANATIVELEPMEDLSARVLLKQIMSTEPHSTPVTRSVSKEQSSALRCITRSRVKAGREQMPQKILRDSIKRKMRESLSRDSLLPVKKPTALASPKKGYTLAASSSMLDDEETPRHILENILQTDTVKPRVVQEGASPALPQMASADSSIADDKHQRTDLSELDLDNLTFANVASISKGLKRKRPRRSLNVTAFEEHLKRGCEDAENEEVNSTPDDLSLSLSNVTSLVNDQTEQKGLRRRVSYHHKITEDEFGDAVNKMHLHHDAENEADKLSRDDLSLSISNVTSLADDRTEQKGLRRRVSYHQKVTEDEFGDAVNKMHLDHDAANEADRLTRDDLSLCISNVTTLADDRTERKALRRRVSYHRKITEDEFGDAVNKMHLDHGSGFVLEEPGPGETARADTITPGPSERDEFEVTDDIVNSNTALCPQPDAMQDKSTVEVSQVQRVLEQDGARILDVTDGLVSRTTADCEEEAVSSESKDETELELKEEEVEETAVDPKTEELPVALLEEVEDAATPEKEEAAPPIKEGEDAVISEEEEAEAPPGEEEDVTTCGDEGAATDSQTESVVDSRSQEDGATGSQSEEGDVAENENDGPQEEEEEEEEEEESNHDVEHIEQRSHLSSGPLVVPIAEVDATQPGSSESENRPQSESSSGFGSAPDVHQNSSSPAQGEASDTGEEPDCGDLNSSHLLRVSNADEEADPPAEVADSTERVEDSEEDDGQVSEEIPMTTPAFVREKRKTFQVPYPISPTVFKPQASRSTEGVPPVKKSVRKRRSGAAPTVNAGLPKNYVMGAFRHFAKAKVSADVYPVVKDIMDKFLERMAHDLETFAVHAGRKTIEIEDVELLLRRQGHVNDKVPVEVLIEKYLRMEQRKLLIPIATSGNVVVPKMKKR